MTKRIKLVFINGLARSGKDTFTQLLAGISSASHDIYHKHISSIDAVRDALRKAGVPVDDKTPEMRQVLALAGSAMERKTGFRTKSVLDEIVQFISNNDDPNGIYLIAVHVREEDVADSIEMRVRQICHEERMDIKVYSVRVERTGSNTEGVSSVDNEKTINWDRKYDFQILNIENNLSHIAHSAAIVAKEIMKD